MAKQERTPTPPLKKHRRFPSSLMDVLHVGSARRGEKLQIAVIINPAAGQGRPVLKVANRVFKSAGVAWEAFITHETGDARNLAEAAAKAGVDVVAVFGGDGTVNEAASGLVGSNVPLAILPGGTNNATSLAFGIPFDLEAACRLAANREAPRQTVDIARIGDRYFLQLAGVGLEAKLVENASREMKDRFGMLAYGLAALQALSDPPNAHYRLMFAEREVEVEGVSCLIANGNNLGISSLGTSDGLLDIFVLRKADLGSLINLAARLAGMGENPAVLPHYHASQVSIDADPPQVVQADGEIVGKTPVQVSLVPRALQIIVPRLVTTDSGEQD